MNAALPMPSHPNAQTATHGKRSGFRRLRRGIILIELIVTLLTVSVVVGAVAILFDITWVSYSNTLYQNTANMEARRALDEICEDIRYAGQYKDAFSAEDIGSRVWASGSQAKQILFPLADYSSPIDTTYHLETANGINYMGRLQGNPPQRLAIAQYVDDVYFEYEYRHKVPGSNQWEFIRTNALTDEQAKAVSTIYVTVKATITIGSGPNQRIYTRTLRSAAHPRTPYNVMIPPGAN